MAKKIVLPIWIGIIPSLLVKWLNDLITNTPVKNKLLTLDDNAQYPGATIAFEADVADYGGAFVNYTPPAGITGLLVIATDTNATTPGKRLYSYANAVWSYVTLT